MPTNAREVGRKVRNSRSISSAKKRKPGDVPSPSLSVMESVVNELLEAIHSGSLEAGQRLPSERELVDLLGAGRSTIREALQVLIGMNLLEARRGSGYFVKVAATWSPYSIESGHPAMVEHQALLDLIDARMVLEPEIAAWAAVHATPKDIKNLESLLNRLAQPRAQGDLTFPDFHVALAQATHNSAMVHMVQSFVSVVGYWSRQYLRKWPQHRESEVRSHAELIEGLKLRSPAAMREKMKNHLVEARETLLSYLDATRQVQVTPRPDPQPFQPRPSHQLSRHLQEEP